MSKINKHKKRHNKRKTRKITGSKLIDNSFPERKEKKSFNQLSNLYKKAHEEAKKTTTLKKLKREQVSSTLTKKVFNLHKLLQTNVKLSAKDDFYTFANLVWLNKFKNKKEELYYTQIDNFRVTQDKVYYELMDIVKNYLKKNKNQLSKKLGNMYYSWLNLSPFAAKKQVKDIVHMIDDYRQDPKNLWKFLSNVSKNEIVKIGNPLHWSMEPDMKNSKVYANYIYGPQFGLYDLDIYFLTKNSHYKERDSYISYINKIFNTCLGPNHGCSGKDVFELEKEMIIMFDCRKIKEDPENVYNKIKTKEGLEKYKFNWEEYAKGLGYKQVPPFFITSNLNYLLCMSKLLEKDWTNEKWRSYWIYMYLGQLIRFHKDWRYIYFNYHEKKLGGQATIFPKEIYPIFGLAIAFNTFLTKEYVEKAYKKENVDYTKRMAANLLELLINRIKKNTWLSPKTKVHALKKLEHIDFMIGAPEKLRNDPLLDYTKDDPWENMQMIFEWRAKQYIKLNDKTIIDIPDVNWKIFKVEGSQAYVVNAYYMPIFNQVYMPLAYLQNPFLDLQDTGIEYNLAFLGFTIGHELCHCLDDMGSKYDHEGNLKNWWTPHDKKVYKQKIKNINEQYIKFMGYDKIKTDVSLYIGENMADIGGLALCSDYLVLYHTLKRNVEAISITFLSFKMFYNFYAMQMRQKIHDEAFDIQLKTNPHPLDKYRCNCPLARLDMFRKLYQIKPNDKMYWPSNDTIW
tara:strand:- start:7875 stop:10082 length:2208 start_codon:yes stop_codon:yes gene_type:complete